MTPIISPWWFYLFDITEKLGIVSKIVAIILATGGVIYFLIEFFGQNKIKWNKLYVVMLIVSTFLTIVVPTKETCYQMAAASLVTPNNLTIAGETVTDVIDYIVDSVDKALDEEDDE